MGKEGADQGTQDLHPLDGVDPQLTLQVHVRPQHLRRIAGALADYGAQGRGHILPCRRRIGRRPLTGRRPGNDGLRRRFRGRPGTRGGGRRRDRGRGRRTGRTEPGLHDPGLGIKEGLHHLLVAGKDLVVGPGHPGRWRGPGLDRTLLPGPGTEQGGIHGLQRRGVGPLEGPGPAAVHQPGRGRGVGPGGRPRGRDRLQVAVTKEEIQVNAHPVRRQPTQAVQQADHARTARQVGGQGQVRPVGQDRIHEPAQDPARSNLDKEAGAGLEHGLDLADKLDPVHQVFGQQPDDPLPRGRVGRRGPVGIDREGRSTQRHVGQELLQPGRGAGHHRRVEGAGHRDGPGRDAGVGELLHRLPHGALQAGDDGLFRGIEIGDPDAGPVGKDSGHPVPVRPHRCHGPWLGIRGLDDEPAPGLGEADQVVKGKDPGRAQGRILAIAVAAGHVRPDPAAGKQLEQGQVSGAHGRLGVTGPGQGPGLAPLFLPGKGRRRIDHPGQGLLQLFPQEGVGTGKQVVDRGKADRDIGQHVHVLGALAGKEEGDPARVGLRVPVDAPGIVYLVRAGEQHVGPLQVSGQVVRRGRDQGQGDAALGPGRLLPRAQGEIGQARPPIRPLQPPAPLPDLAAERCRGGLPEQEQLGILVTGAGGPGCGQVGPVLLQDNVEIGAAESQGTDPGPARLGPAAVDPWPGAGIDIEGAVLLLQDPVGLFHAQGRRQDPVPQGQDRLDHAGDTGRGLGVADHRLDRAHAAGAGPCRGRAQQRAQGLELHLVTEHGAGAVRLDEPHRGRGETGLSIGPAKGRDLAFPARRGQAPVPAVTGGAHALDHGVDDVAVRLGVGQPLEDQHGHALAEDNAVGLLVKGTAAAPGRQGPGL